MKHTETTDLSVWLLKTNSTNCCYSTGIANRNEKETSKL